MGVVADDAENTSQHGEKEPGKKKEIRTIIEIARFLVYRLTFCNGFNHEF